MTLTMIRGPLCGPAAAGPAPATGSVPAFRAAFDRLDRRLVLAPDIAALDPQSAVDVDADEHAGAGDFGGVIGDRPFVERRQRGLDLAKPRVHLVRQLHGVGVFLLQGVMLGPQRFPGRAFLFGESNGLPGQAAQPVGVAIRKVERDRDPLPALRAQGLGLGLQLLVRQPVEQRRVLEPAALVVLEQVAQHDAAGRLIGRDADELRPPVAGADRAFGQLAADEVGRLVVAEGAPRPAPAGHGRWSP